MWRAIQIGALVSFQDVSTLQQAENKLREAYDQLNETVTELNFQKYALDQHDIVSIADQQREDHLCQRKIQ